MRRVLCLVAAVTLIAGCGSSSSGASSELHKLEGKQLPGVSGEWIAIASPYKKPADIAGTDAPPVQTNSTSNTVAFFEFATPAAAEAFYREPPIAARLISTGIQQHRPLTGIDRSAAALARTRPARVPMEGRTWTGRCWAGDAVRWVDGLLGLVQPGHA